MRNVNFGPMPEAIYNTAVYFKNTLYGKGEHGEDRRGDRGEYAGTIKLSMEVNTPYAKRQSEQRRDHRLSIQGRIDPGGCAL